MPTTPPPSAASSWRTAPGSRTRAGESTSAAASWPGPSATTSTRWGGCSRFEQVDGDLERFVGRWEIDEDGSGSRLTFFAELDLGIPSLAPIVDPVARQALDGNMRTILRGLFADARLDIDDVAPAWSSA